MLQSIKQLYGNRLRASDGDIGEVKDFYFDDQNLAIRYVVADTGHWLRGRLVLLSPHAFGTRDPAAKVMVVNLSRKQIEESPAVEAHKPVSRQYEEEYHRYYGWPYYWKGDGLWGGLRGSPVLEVPYDFFPAKPTEADPKTKDPDVNLRSTQAVSGYHLQATDGIFGHVSDFLMDDKTWAINQLVVKIGHRLTGKEVQIPMSQVERISYKESTVYVKLNKEAVENSPEHRLVPDPGVIPASALSIR